VARLDELFQRLCDADVDFVIVGGLAATLHGSAMVTQDIDVCAILTAESVSKLRETLRDLSPAHRLTSPRQSFLDHADIDATLKNLYLQTSLGPLDVLSSILGVGDFERVRANSIEIQVFGRRCRLMSVEDLILSKETLARDKDLMTAKELRSILATRKPE
jgi:predicted nucleotidyltransferase